MFKSKGSYTSLNNSELSNKIGIIKSEFIKSKKSKKYQRSFFRKKILKKCLKYFIFILIIIIISIFVFRYVFKYKFISNDNDSNDNNDKTNQNMGYPDTNNRNKVIEKKNINYHGRNGKSKNITNSPSVQAVQRLIEEIDIINNNNDILSRNKKNKNKG